VVYSRRNQEKKFAATFIDHGHCFGGPQGTFRRLPTPSLDTIAADSGTWYSWIDRIQALPIQCILDALMAVPSEWQEGWHTSALAQKLVERQKCLSSMFLSPNCRSSIPRQYILPQLSMPLGSSLSHQ
jgi:hypothetical protein